MYNKNIVFLLASLVVIASCRKNDQIPNNTQPIPVTNGFYLLNQGNMNQNNASLDYFDYASSVYARNIFKAANPNTDVLGDTGNDMAIYGSKLYVIMNGSNKLEIADAITAKRIKVVTIPNVRNITFHKNKAYVSAYGNTLNASSANGVVIEMDTATLSTTRTIEVGRQPEGLAIVGDQLYVANSGGYDAKNYERTVTVINLNSFAKIKNIDVAINLDKIKKDKENNLYVSNRGNYNNIVPKLYFIDTKQNIVKDSFNIPVSNMTIAGDSVYIIGTVYKPVTFEAVHSFNIINTKTRKAEGAGFITDGTEKNIQSPYGVAVDPLTRNIMVTDARDYQSSGNVIIYNAAGKKLQTYITGLLPLSIVFTTK